MKGRNSPWLLSISTKTLLIQLSCNRALHPLQMYAVCNENIFLRAPHSPPDLESSLASFESDKKLQKSLMPSAVGYKEPQ